MTIFNPLFPQGGIEDRVARLRRFTRCCTFALFALLASAGFSPLFAAGGNDDCAVADPCEEEQQACEEATFFAPVITCKDITVLLGASGTGGYQNGDPVLMVNDPVPITGGPFTVGGPSKRTFDCTAAGTTVQRMVTYTNAMNQKGFCTYNVTIEDNIDPVVTCQDITIELDATGNASFENGDAVTGTSDNCGTIQGPFTMGGPSQKVFDCSAASTTVSRTVVVRDASNNTGTCTYNVTIEDNIDPVVTCQDITIELDATGNASFENGDAVTGTSDNCGTIQGPFTMGGPSQKVFDCSDAGTTVSRTVVVRDASNNTGTCTYNVTIEDNIVPTIICNTGKGDITVSNDPGQCGAIVMYGNQPSDNCPGFTVAQTAGNPNATFFPIGTTTNSFTVTDASGNQASCSFTVTVNDTEDPTIVCNSGNGDITVSNDEGQCGANVMYGNQPADNCPGFTVAQTAGNPNATFFPVGTTVNSFTVTDAAGNQSSCSFSVTVNDTEDPTIICNSGNGDITVSNDEGQCGANVMYGNQPADNCPGFTVAQTAGNPNATFFPVGTTVNSFTVTDAAGNQSSCSFSVTVNDTEDPTIICNSGNGDITVSNDAGQCGANVMYGNQPSDNCPGFTVAQTAGNPNATFFPVGTTVNSFTVTDAAGNQSSCSFSVTVNDTEDPTIICNSGNGDITVSNDAGQCGATVMYGNQPADNCGFTVAQTAGNPNATFFPVGTTVNSFTVTDAGGNMASCSFSVTVNDTEKPVISCSDITIELGTDGTATFTRANLISSATDNCTAEADLDGPFIVMANAVRDLDCDDAGQTFVRTISYADESGNRATCDFNLTVEDNLFPVVSCSDVTIQLGSNGTATFTQSDLISTATDNCTKLNGPFIVNANAVRDYDCDDAGMTFVRTISYADASGNRTTCDFNLTVGGQPVAAIQPVGPTDNEFCEDVNPNLQEVAAVVPASPIVLVWRVTSVPAAANLPVGTIFTGDVQNAPDIRSFADGRLRAKNAAAIGTYTFEAFGRNTANSCEGPVTTFTLTKNATPATPATNGPQVISFCPGASVGERQISVQNNNGSDEEFAWIVESGPGYSGSTEVVVGDPNFATINNATSQLRAKSGAAVGTYTLSVIRRNTVTGCVSEKLTGYMVTKNASPAAPTANGPQVIAFCPGASVGERQISVQNDNGSDEEFAWIVESGPGYSGSTEVVVGDPNFATINNATTQLRAKSGAAVGTYTLSVIRRNTVTGCVSAKLTGYEVTKNATPAAPTANGPQVIAFCPGASVGERQISAQNDNGSDEEFAWIVESGPGYSGSTEVVVGDPNFATINNATTQLRAKSGAAVGTYMLSVIRRNTVTGCESAKLTGYKVTKNATPAAPAANGPQVIAFCPGASVGERQISAQNDNGSDEEFAWIVESGPGYSGSTEVVVGDPNFATINNATTQLRAKSDAAVGTYTLSVIRRNTLTGCESAKLTGYEVTKNATPATPAANGPQVIAFCPGASVGERQISVQNNNGSDEEFAWIVESGPGYSGSTEVVVGDPNFATINNATTQLRAKSGAAVGTYMLSVIRRNTVTGCVSEKLTGYDGDQERYSGYSCRERPSGDRILPRRFGGRASDFGAER